MKKAVYSLSFLLFLFACSPNLWDSEFVQFNDITYILTNEEIEQMNIEQFLGQITVNANEDNAYGGNFSNIYEVGTKLYQILDISPNEAIAIEIEEGKYIKAMFQE